MEGIIDPIGAIAVVLRMNISSRAGRQTDYFYLARLSLSSTGPFGAFVLANVVKRHMLPEFLHNVFTLAFVLLLFSISNHIEHESSACGHGDGGSSLWKGFPKDDILEFNESLTVLLISVPFIVLAARVELLSLMKSALLAWFYLASSCLLPVRYRCGHHRSARCSKRPKLMIVGLTSGHRGGGDFLVICHSLRGIRHSRRGTASSLSVYSDYWYGVDSGLGAKLVGNLLGGGTCQQWRISGRVKPCIATGCRIA